MKKEPNLPQEPPAKIIRETDSTTSLLTIKVKPEENCGIGPLTTSTVALTVVRASSLLFIADPASRPAGHHVGLSAVGAKLALQVIVPYICSVATSDRQ